MEKRREKKANLSEEEKKELKKKDRIRKMTQRIMVAEKEKEKEEKTESYADNEKEHNKLYKRRAKEGKSGEEIDYDRIETILKMRKSRQYKCGDGCGFDGKLHLLHNLIAKIDMRSLKNYGRIKDYMRRAAREKDEEMLWHSFWCRNSKNRELLAKKKPELAEKFKKMNEDRMRTEDERRKKEKELDEKGRWNFNAGDGEYYWSIPDEKGHSISLSTFNMTVGKDYCDATIEAPSWPNDMEEKGDEDWEKQLKKWEEQEKEEKRKEANRKQNERRQKVREELAQPIDMPEQDEKGEYEKCRDENILERHEAMKESGLFTDDELKAMLTMII